MTHGSYNTVLADFINGERAKRKNKTRRKFLQTELLHVDRGFKDMQRMLNTVFYFCDAGRFHIRKAL